MIKPISIEEKRTKQGKKGMKKQDSNSIDSNKKRKKRETGAASRYLVYLCVTAAVSWGGLTLRLCLPAAIPPVRVHNLRGSKKKTRESFRGYKEIRKCCCWSSFVQGRVIAVL